MKNFSITKLLIIFSLLTLSGHTFAAKLTFEAPDVVPSNGKPIAVRVFVDGEGQVLSSLSGTFSFSSKLFDVGEITTQSSIVSVWVKHPSVNTDKNFDDRTRVNFEGIMPGGFSGVRSPYYDGVRPGVVFTVTLLPKNKGADSLLLDEIELHAYDNSGTLLPANNYNQIVSIPELTAVVPRVEKVLTKVDSNTLTASLARDPLIDHNAWYLVVGEDESIRPINHIEVAESSEYSAERVSPYEWKTINNPYVLLYQSRVKYVHVKVIYENNSFALKTIPPVENSPINSYLSLILLSIVIVIFVLYRYGKLLKRII